MVDASLVPGFVVMAVYRPDPQLFARQVASLRAQTVTDWRCLMGIDGSDPETMKLAEHLVDGDPRFDVVEYDQNVGVYRHFERLLAAVPGDVAWVSLADQDDYWYPDKFERLLPALAGDGVTAVSGQALIVDVEGRTSGRTHRRPGGLGQTMLRNQLTGSLTLVRRDVLNFALPFPAETDIAIHDHWMAVCAARAGRLVAVESVVQDYVQHATNVLGEARSTTLWEAIKEVKSRGGLRTYLERSSSNRWGWRVFMARALLERPTDLRSRHVLQTFGDGGLSLSLIRHVSAGVAARRIRPLTALATLVLAEIWSHAEPTPPTKRALRVVFLLPGVARRPVGGYKVVYDYSNRLERLGFEVVIAHCRLLSGPADLLRIRKVISAIRRDRPARARPAWFALSSHVRVRNYLWLVPWRLPKGDVLVATSADTAPMIHRAAMRQGVGGVYFIQQYETWHGEEFVRATWELPLRRLVISDWLACVGRSLGVDTALVPNGIDLEAYPVGPEFESRSRDLLAMVSEQPWKRTDLVVSAMQQLVKSRPGFKGATFGTCSRPPGLPDEVIHVQDPPPAELAFMYRGAKVYMCASDHEGWHLPPAEAMSSGCAIVSTDIGGVRAYANGVAQFVQPGSAAALVQGVVGVLSRPQLGEELSRIGRHRIEELSAERAAVRLAEELRQVASGTSFVTSVLRNSAVKRRSS